MRVLHIVPYYYPAMRYGGPVRSVHGLASATASLGHSVHVYTTNIDGTGVSDVPVNVATVQDGVQVRYFSAGLGRRVFRAPSMAYELNRTITEFDIVHIHCVWSWTTNLAASMAVHHRVPYVLSPRGMLVDDLIRKRSFLTKKVWLMLFERRNVSNAAGIHVTAELEADEFKRLRLKSSEIFVIENGIGQPPLDRDPRFEDERSSIRPYIIFLGRLSWKKGLDRLIAAMKGVPGIDLVIAGYDEDGYKEKMKRLSETVGIQDRVRFIGPLEGVDKWRWIRSARCLVLPSYNENFGNSALEAMAVGCPVVVSKDVGLAPVIRSTHSGLVVSGEPEELGAALRDLLNDPLKRGIMGVNGVNTAREIFGWPGIAKRTIAQYSRCITLHNSPTLQTCG